MFLSLQREKESAVCLLLHVAVSLKCLRSMTEKLMTLLKI